MSVHQLRDIKPTDASWVFDACQDEQIQYWTTVPKPYLMEHTNGFTVNALNEYKIWVIENEDSQPVGVISIHKVDEHGVAEIGYWVAPWGRGSGAVVNAIGELEKLAKNYPNIKTIQATISDLNEVSQKVALRAGLLKQEASCKACPAGGVDTTATYYRKVLAV
jgi:RimJ/RimL family protein N-acetyltransferase